jgi:CRISPR-associated protein (TIGR03986 family)
MSPKHSNATQQNRIAHAPYNFVPLPEKVIRVNYKIPDHDSYTGHTGYLDCTLTALTPLYTRTALDPDFFVRWEDNAREMMRDGLARERYAQFFKLDDAQRPIIPGSSLRGMIRELVEIIGQAKMQWVGDDLKVTFRAVAALKDDPLKLPYDRIIGKSGRNVCGGYLLLKNGDWYVQPSMLPSDFGWPGQDTYLKVKESQIPANSIPGFIRFNDPAYQPQYHEISFDAQTRSGTRGKYIAIIGISTNLSNYPHRGVLVCSGNMLETAKSGQPSPRTTHAIVLAADQKAAPIKVSRQFIADYIDSLTSFQKETPFNEQKGCLLEGRPVFYVEEGSEVIAFGHSPNFRIPAWLNGTRRAATPLDMVPKEIRQYEDQEDNEIIDLAEAIFGYIADGKKISGRAGRVSFTDAICDPGQDDIWLPELVITPQILGGPKPTTFQHYLVQDADKGHDPDHKRQLAYYGTPTSDETIIRGYKLYWHKHEGLTAKDFSEKEEVDWKSDTQHTRIKPVAKGVTFNFRAYFENLTDVEIGALLWVLDLPDGYHHKVGMGKPLGLGSVDIEPRLTLIDRSARYKKLLDANGWYTGNSEKTDFKPYKQAFEEFILNQYCVGQELNHIQNLAQVPRVQMLLKMLKWPGPNSILTRYMKIEPINEYKDRPVLPDPLNVDTMPLKKPQIDIKKYQSNSSSKSSTDGKGDSGLFKGRQTLHAESGLKGNQTNPTIEIKKLVSPTLPSPKTVASDWLDNEIGKLAKQFNKQPSKVLSESPKEVAKVWSRIETVELKAEVLEEIKRRYGDLWNDPPKSLRKAKSEIYGAGPKQEM